MDPSASLKALSQRMAQVAARHSQSEIARRTGTSRNNVSRYARGARMPLEFGAALCSELGVNPAWLLMGEGAPWLSDNAAGNEKLAGDLLELVEAMNSVARMRLGSLTGKHHLRVLRELNDALERYEKLRAELNVRTSPIFDELLKQYSGAVESNNLNAADDLSRALTQLARLNDDTVLQARFDALLAHHRYIQGKVPESIDIQRDVLFHALSRGRLDAESLNEAHNLAMSLYQLSRHAEARRILQAVMTLVPPELRATPEAELADGLLGVIEVDMGEVAQGLIRLQRNVAAHADIYLGHSSGFLVRAQLLAGMLTLEAAFSLGEPSRGRALRVLQWAAWLEDKALLKRACREGIGPRPEQLPEAFVFAQYARALLAALEGDMAPAKAYLSEQVGARSIAPGEPVVRFGVQMNYCRLARAAGQPAAAVKYLHEADQRLHEIPPEYTPDVLARAAHYRNALLLPGARSSLKSDATRFFREQVSRGFGSLLGCLRLAL